MMSFLDMKMGRRCVAGALLFGFSAMPWAARNRAELIPFSIETYMAITKEGLLEKPGRQCSLLKPDAARSLLEKSKETSRPFEDGRVRGLLEENGVTTFVDADGVFDYGSRHYVVTEKDFRGVLEMHFNCTPAL